MNCDVRECMHLWYKHDITLYNLIFRKKKKKKKRFVMIQNIKTRKKKL